MTDSPSVDPIVHLTPREVRGRIALGFTKGFALLRRYVLRQALWLSRSCWRPSRPSPARSEQPSTLSNACPACATTHG